ncbi:SspB family protein [Roseovarius rhodophyticola]|uniref:ClpXP protease specificity-enhancing factor SspB n=1 Tax=Roseovarius rhodophyticola TaxID=3080827 RepID=A0ABZ2TEJ4_9RHOB
MTRSIDYGKLMHRAMRNLIQDVLCDVRDNGLPGAHHFFITFETTHPETNIADWLKERYPSEMTVVMQHWFDNLTVTDDGFSVTLNFGDQPENLYIPYDAIQTFVDPSVEFGLRFESQEDEDEEDTASQTDSSDEEVAAPEPDTAVEADVVSLDSFRK